MRRLLLTVLCVVFACSLWAQQPSNDAPASKQDVQRYFEAVHSRAMVDQILQSMMGSMQQMVHEEYLKHKDVLPPDFEAVETRHLDAMMKNMPWDELFDSMIPAYQKHFTKGDIDALVAFYNSPPGQKLLRELPAVMAESMQAVMPIMQRQVEVMTKQMQSEMAELINKASKANSEASPPKD